MATLRKQNLVKIVILAGGTGTRLWPWSRASKPKQVQSFFGKDTLLQETVARVKRGFDKKDIIIAIGQDQVGQVKAQLPRFPLQQIFVEPEKKDTAAAIGLAAIRLYKENPKTIMVMTNSDFYIKEVDVYLQAVKKGIGVVQKNPNKVVLIGLKPEYPETGYGYIKVGMGLVETPSLASVQKFVEKPDLKTAEKYLASGNYFWNPAMFIWRVDHLLELYKKHLPDQYKILMKIKESLGTKNEAKVLKAEFTKIKPVSVDYGILEKLPSKSMLMVPANFTWRDVGSWRAVHEVSSVHPKENVIRGQVVPLESYGNLVYSVHDKKIIALAGVEDMVIIDTKDALFVCPKNKSQMVKKVISELKGKKDLNKFL